MSSRRTRQGDLRGVIDRATSVLAALGGAIVAVLALLITASAIPRVLGFGSIGGAYELSEMLLVALALLGVAYTQQRGEHISATVFTSRLPVKSASYFRAGSIALCIAIVAVMVYATSARAVESFVNNELRPSTLTLPEWPVRALIVLGLFVLLLQLCLKLGEHIRNIRGPRSGRECATRREQVSQELLNGL